MDLNEEELPSKRPVEPHFSLTISNIDNEIDRDKLMLEFNAKGYKVKDAIIYDDKDPHYGFLNFDKIEDSERVLNEMNK